MVDLEGCKRHVFELGGEHSIEKVCLTHCGSSLVC